MATSAVPSLIDALVAAARTSLPGLSVRDGMGVTEDYGDALYVGTADPDAAGWQQAANSQQSWANATYTDRDEEGDISCAARSWTGEAGEAGQKAARDAAYATTTAVENLLRANPSLGLPTLLWTGFGSTSQLEQIQDENGSAASVVFSVHYRARI